MHQQVLVLAGAIGLLSGVACTANAEERDSEKLQGTWVITSFEIAGRNTPAPEGGGAYTFNKGKVVMKEKGRPDKEGTYKVDSSKTPKQLDLTIAEGKDKETMEGIYELKGDTLKVAYSIQGPKGKRPTSFDSKAAAILHLKREKR